MSNTVWVLLVAVVLVAGVIWYQKTRTDRVLQTLTETGFVVSRQWRANVLVVADDSSGRLAVVWPTGYTLVTANQLTEVSVTGQEMDANRHRYTLELSFDHPELSRLGLAMNQRRDKAESWAQEFRQWRDQHR